MLRLCARGISFKPYRSLRNLSYSRPLRLPRDVSQQLKPSGPTAPIEFEGTFAKSVKPTIRNQVLFFALGSTSILLYSAWATNLDTAVVLEKLQAQSTIWQAQSISNRDLRRFQQSELVQQLRSTYKYLATQASEIPQVIRPYITTIYLSVFQPYADASDGRRLCWKICMLNAGIWFMWQFQRLQPMMTRSFIHHPLSGLSYTLLTSTFSHASFLHLAFNCLALEGFGSAASTYLRQSQEKQDPSQLESTSAYHFMTFFASAGIFASLVSHIASARIRYPKLVAQLTSPASKPPVTETWASAVAAAASSTTRSTASSSAAAAAKAVSIPGSLGASGAVYSCVTLVALAYPGSQISLIFPPMMPIDIQTGVMGLVALDMFGIYRGWRMFDHWAHLGGAAFGAMYYYCGPRIWSSTRGVV
ncbi:hypothetical protein GYMLUDRAFT_200694 [Collybiopsis luxurians FD-317 M1]|uniref:Peptidase S54 rhomboid domain-containing protein n=1 Tax=Collybiopsis luxurians FD-317 M1 TaxID=944289 RepID=A0A0D0CDH5_9AGAR|nr:hypothetical protein GYMLUDRAFT_200694 [Collybiopsis luxurians FD-317 M1]